MVAVGFPVAFCIAPSDFGVTFARLGVPEKFAFGVDLTFRFIPSLAADTSRRSMRNASAATTRRQGAADRSRGCDRRAR